MVEVLKKQWFVVLIAVILLFFLVFTIYDTNKGKLAGKSVDGKDVIASVADTDITADDVFAQLKEQSMDEMLFMQFQFAVASAAVETTDEIEQEAQELVESTEEGFKSYDPTNYKDMIQQQLETLGFKDLNDYCMKTIKLKHLQTDYMDANMEELFTPIYDEKNSRIVSHILVKMEDAENPTEEEKKKVEEIDQLLKDGTDFATVAKDKSDDTSSAVEGGSIGYVDEDSGLVTEFKEMAMKLKKGEVSDWVKVTSTNYSGWHKILVVETDKAAIMNSEDELVRNGIYQAIQTKDPDLTKNLIWNKSKELNVEFGSDEIKKQLMDYLEIKEGE